MINNKKIWLVNVEELLDSETKDLLKWNYDVKWIDSLSDINLELQKEKPLLILTNILDEKTNIFEVSKSEIFQNKNVPFFILSDIDEIEFVKLTLKTGALDFMKSPINKNVLISKVEHFIETKVLKTKIQSTFRDIFEKMNLTIKEAKILNKFLSSQDYRVHRTEFLETIWGKLNVHEKTLDVHLYNLRRKLEKSQYKIISEGKGYYVLYQAPAKRVEAFSVV
jgi:DNA-binding response OmpR family regulator